MIDINKIKEEFIKHPTTQELIDTLVSAGASNKSAYNIMVKISDWWLSKLSQALETRNKELVEEIKAEEGFEVEGSGRYAIMKDDIITLIQSK